MKNIFAQRLNDLLKEQGISKRKYAQQIGVSAMSVSDWTTGKVQPTAENIYITAKYFNVSSDYLLGLENEDGTKTYNNTYNNYGTHNGNVKF